jgi:putative transposase
LLFERGVIVTYEMIRCWCDKFGVGFAHRVKAAHRKPGSTWHLDEMFVNCAASLTCCGVRSTSTSPNSASMQKRRDKAAATRFFKYVLRSSPVPRKIVTDQLRSYPAAKAEIPELANVKHVLVKASARLNNRAENSHQPTRESERRMCGFRDPQRTQKFLSCFGPIRQHFALKWHLLRASLYRKQLAARLVRGAKSPKSPEIRPTLSERCSLLPSFRLSLDKLTKPRRSEVIRHRESPPSMCALAPRG